MSKLTDFKNDRKWVARRLRMSLAEVNAAIEILHDQGHLKVDEEMWEVRLKGSRWDGVKYPHRDKKNYQKQVLDKAKEAIDDVSQDARHAFSLTFAANTDILPYARQKIRDLCEELSAVANSQPQKDEVFQIHCSFFPLTKFEKLV